MFSSRLFWRLFGAYVGLSLIAAVIFVALLTQRLRESVVGQMQNRLHDSATVLRNRTLPLFAGREAPDLQRALTELGRATGTRFTLVAEDGIVFGDSSEDPALMENHRDREELRQARLTGQGLSQRTSPTLGIPMMYYALRVGPREAPEGYVRVSLSMDSVEASVQRVQRLIWGTSAAIAVAVTCVTWFVTRRVIRPLETLTTAARAMEEGDLRQSVDVRGRDEIATLATAFNAMSSQLASRIEELQEQTRRLEENGELLGTVLGSMVEGVVAIDAQRRILFANDAARRFLDFATPDVVGRPLAELARQPTIQQSVSEVLAGERLRRVEFELARTQRVIAMVATRLPGRPSGGAVVVLHDVSELRRLEALRREFVANVSHELKTPLTTIKAYTETLLGGAIDDDGHNRRFLKRIEEQADRLQVLILDLLQLGRLESNDGAAAEFEELVVATIVTDCVAGHQTVAAAQDVDLAIGRIDEADRDVAVLADPEGLRTIVDNLIDNAIKYTTAGDEIRVRWSRHDDEVRIEVEDTGIGIAAEHLPRLFERFYRVDKARSREVGGTGLGLAIVKHLTQSFGGRIEVDSQLGRGSRFTVSLPRHG